MILLAEARSGRRTVAAGVKLVGWDDSQRGSGADASALAQDSDASFQEAIGSSPDPLILGPLFWLRFLRVKASRHQACLLIFVILFSGAL